MNLRARIVRIPRHARDTAAHICGCCRELHVLRHWDADIRSGVCGSCRDTMFEAEKALVITPGLRQLTDPEAVALADH